MLERNLLLIKGAVPGPNGSLLIVKKRCQGRLIHARLKEEFIHAKDCTL